MVASVQTFEVRVLGRATEDSFRDEALAIIDGQDQLAFLSHSTHGHWIGRKPGEVMGPESPYLVTDEPRDVAVACCNCGILGCGSLLARISQVGGHVVWDQFRHWSAGWREVPVDAAPFRFDCAQYEAAILGSGAAQSGWEPTTRRAAFLIFERMGRGTDPDQGIFNARILAHGDQKIHVRAMLDNETGANREIVGRMLSLEPGESAEDLADRVEDYVASGAFLAEPFLERR